MTEIFEVDCDDIIKLNPEQLTDLLRYLLYLEADGFGIPLSAAHIPMKINVPDGGEDGRIQWEDGPPNTDWIPNRFTLFQCKAGKLSPSDCKKEMTVTDETELKPRVKEVFENEGQYILFYGQSSTESQNKDKIEEMRQALRKLKKPYANSAKIEIYDANKIANWVNSKFAAVNKVLRWVGKNVPNGMITWDEWKGYPENARPFFSDDDILIQIEALRKHFSKFKIGRIVGLSGFGKSRLAFEAFRPPENMDDYYQQALSKKVVYIDGSDLNASDIICFRTTKKSGLLIVDNCDATKHDNLAREILHENSDLSLLTIDCDPTTNVDKGHIFKIGPSADSIIESIVKNAYPALGQQDIERVILFAQGFPQIAVLIAEARINEDPDIGVLKSDLLLKKLLWGNKDEDKDEFNALKGGSVFEYFGFEEDLIEQRKFVAKNICGLDDINYHRIFVKYRNRGIIDQRNRYVRVTPRPLAIRLASEWWSETPKDRIETIIKTELPDDMIEPLCNQMRNLHFLPKAQDIVKDLCGPQDPFGQAEILNSDRGSRIFRAMTEVNPVDTTNALQRVFGNCTKDQLLEVGPGRRNLIWSLENLCFWEETFPKAARLMLRFSVAENESWGNNATGQFYILFHYLLSGTQATPDARLAIIKEALHSSDIDVQRIGINAIGHALRTHGFSKYSRVEIQGCRASGKEWEPTIWKDVFDYWGASLEIITPHAVLSDEIGTLAREQILSNFTGLVRYGRINELDKVLTAVCEERGCYWPEALKKIEEIKELFLEKIPEDGQEWLNKWENALQPSTLNERIHYTITSPPVHFNEDSSENEVEFLADELSQDLPTLYSVLPILFEKRQMKGYELGTALGKRISDSSEFIKNSLEILRDIKDDAVDPSVLAGYLHSIRGKQSDLVDITLESIRSDVNLSEYLFYLTRLSEPTEENLRILVSLSSEGKIDESQFKILSYGRVLSHLSTTFISRFCIELSNISIEGSISSLHILYMYSFKDESKLKACLPAIKEILFKKGLLANIHKADQHDQHILKACLSHVLVECEKDGIFALHMGHELVNLCKNDFSSYSFYRELSDCVKILLKDYLDIVWPIFSQELLSGDYKCIHYMDSLLFGGGINFNDSNPPILVVPDNSIIEWCQANPDGAPQIIAGKMPLLLKEEDGGANSWCWHPLVAYLIENFGEKKVVMNKLDENLGTFGITGSPTPYYEQIIDASHKLVAHPNGKVRNWATQNIEQYQELITKTKRYEEEEDCGIINLPMHI